MEDCSQAIYNEEWHNALMPGDRVFCHNYHGYGFLKEYYPATIVARYGKREYGRTYSDLCDVVFDHKPETVSHGHFTSYLRTSP